MLVRERQRSFATMYEVAEGESGEQIRIFYVRMGCSVWRSQSFQRRWRHGLVHIAKFFRDASK